MTAATYRRRPTTVEAIQYTGDNVDEVHAFVCRDANWRDHEADGSACRWNHRPFTTGVAVYDHLHASWIAVRRGDWVVRGPQNENWPVAEDVFAQTYELEAA